MCGKSSGRAWEAVVVDFRNSRPKSAPVLPRPWRRMRDCLCDWSGGMMSGGGYWDDIVEYE